MMPFFNQTGLERFGVVGQRQGCCWAGLQAPDVAILCKDKKIWKGPARASLVAALTPKSVSL